MQVNDGPANKASARLPSAAVARDGRVYVTWWDSGQDRIMLDRSVGTGFGVDQPGPGVDARFGDPKVACFGVAGLRIKAQANECVQPFPIVAINNAANAEPDRSIFVAYITTNLFQTVNEPKNPIDPGNPGATEPAHPMYVQLGQFDRNLKFIDKESPWETSTPNPAGDQFNPSVAFDPSNGFLTACWYDTGEDAPNLVKTRYTCATSPNLAGGWSPTQAIATVPSDATGTGRGRSSLQYGFHTGVVASNGSIHAAWMDTRDFGAGLGGWDIYTQAFKCAGKWNPKGGHWDC
jgi:hypothetical protein